MEIRDLKILKSHNLNVQREFNHLRITNLDKFFSDYGCNLEYYKSPFKLLADLEEEVKFKNDPEKLILCSYKPDGDAIFKFVGIRLEENIRIVEYEFDNFVS